MILFAKRIINRRLQVLINYYKSEVLGNDPKISQIKQIENNTQTLLKVNALYVINCIQIPRSYDTRYIHMY